MDQRASSKVVLARRPLWLMVPLIVWGCICFIPAFSATVREDAVEVAGRWAFGAVGASLVILGLAQGLSLRQVLLLRDEGLFLARGWLFGASRGDMIPWSDIIGAEAVEVEWGGSSFQCLLLGLRRDAPSYASLSRDQLLDFYIRRHGHPKWANVCLLQNDEWQWSPKEAASIVNGYVNAVGSE